MDGYELLAPLDGWFRTQFLPARPAGALTVVAGREAPAAAWWLDQGWRRLVSVHRLDELDDADSRDLLLGLGVTDQVSRLANWAGVIRWPRPCWPRWTGPVADRISCPTSPTPSVSCAP